MVRRCHRDRVDVVALQQAAEIGLRLRTVAGCPLDFGECVGKQALVDIAQVRDPHARHRGELPVVTAAAAADADDCDVDGVARSRLRPAGLGGCSRKARS